MELEIRYLGQFKVFINGEEKEIYTYYNSRVSGISLETSYEISFDAFQKLLLGLQEWKENIIGVGIVPKTLITSEIKEEIYLIKENENVKEIKYDFTIGNLETKLIYDVATDMITAFSRPEFEISWEECEFSCNSKWKFLELIQKYKRGEIV